MRERQQILHQSPRLQKADTPKIGEIVLIKEEDLPRGAWKLAQVEEVAKGTEDQIRVAKVRMPNGHILKRAINFLYPLEIQAEIPKGKEKAQETNVRRPTTRLMTKTQKLATVIAILTIFIHTGSSLKRPRIVLKELKVQECMKRGIVIKQTPDGYYCSDEVICERGVLRPPKMANYTIYCGPECECPTWADGCSFYNGPYKI